MEFFIWLIVWEKLHNGVVFKLSFEQFVEF